MAAAPLNPLTPLPIDAAIPEIVAQLGRNLVLRASPGSGKTTRVPPALLKADFRGLDQEIWVLEPRRLAAKWAAHRVADELGETVGQSVGYHFRFESVAGPRTRLRFLTEGMLIRRLLSNSGLKSVCCVILDEFHERHLQGDTALSYLRHLQLTRRPDLRLLVMSATLDTEAVAAFLSDPGDPCPVVNVEARQFPVELEYQPAEKSLDRAVADAVREVEGGILVFLPGMAEIQRCHSALQPVAEARGIGLHILHGDLSRDEQDRAIRSRDRGKIILSTNIAESSLTIEGITTVIDSGLHRQASYSWWSGMPALRTRPISRASAIQRAGRAGRTAPGKCIRLYARGDFESRIPFDVPEIRRADLSEAILELKLLGVPDLNRFSWFEKPPENSLKGAVQLLYRLGALTEEALNAQLSEIGERLGRVSVHPRLGRVMLEAEKLGILQEAAALCAWIAEGELDALNALEMLRRPLPMRGKKVQTQLLSHFRQQGSAKRPNIPEVLARALLAGFPDRVCRKKKYGAQVSRGKNDEVELVFSSGGSSRVLESSVIAEHEYFVVLDVQERQFQEQLRSEAKVRSVVPIEPDWLLDISPGLVHEREQFIWDSDRQQLQLIRRLQYDELILDEETRKPDALDPKAQERLVEAVWRAVFKFDPERRGATSLHDWITILARVAPQEQIEAVFARLILLGRTAGLPGLAGLERGEGLFEIVSELIRGKISLRELQSIDWGQELITAAATRFELPLLHGELEKNLPESFALPSGRKLRIQYLLGQSPSAASRLQDFFGMGRGPILCQGRVPLTLHLLAPNQRAVQVTTDLAGFWERGYRELRNQLQRRYPRHDWPEDPLHAAPPAPRPRRQ